jgi:hypothetical protein
LRKKLLIITLLVLLVVFALGPVMSLPVSAEENADRSEVETADVQPTATIFTEGFEGVWPGSWVVGDSNSLSGLDYWGDSSVRAHSGFWSGWCNDYPTPSATSYDDNMRAYMYRTVSLTSYASVSLSYYYYLRCESGYDYLQVIYYSGGWHYVDTHTGDLGNAWHYSTVSIPNTAIAVGFYFVSDGSISTLIGAYVDDVTLTGVTTIPTVLDFEFNPNPVQTDHTCTLSGTLKTTGGSPVYPASVTVDYSTDGGATWHYAFTLSTNAAGAFSTSFTAPAPGTYLVRGSYAGSGTYNPSSHTETLTITPAAWGDYHFRLSPYTDVIHIKISGSVIYGVAEVPGMFSDAPLLGYIEGSTFYIFVDIPDGAYSTELSMMVGSTSTLSGNVYRTLDGTSWSGPIAFNLVSAASTSASSATESVLASAAKPEAWPPTYHFQLSPWIDIAHLGVSGSVINGQDEAAGLYYNRPVLGYVSGSFFILGFDWPAGGYHLGIIRASTSTMSGYAYRTTDGKSYYSGPTITFVPV